MRILYGVPNVYIDITDKVSLLCKIAENIFLIPKNDDIRARMFSDPCAGIEKHILIEQGGKFRLYDAEEKVVITLDNANEIENKLKEIQNKLQFVGGTLKDEYDEQIMTTRFIKPDAKVLELGSNIGRNTLVISSILNDSKNLVTLETDPKSVEILKQNRDLNKFSFNIINAALSKIPLFQKDWTCVPVVPEGVTGFTPVLTITYDEIKTVFGQNFDTLVADCEGGLYHVFGQFPEILKDLKLIIMENDFIDLNHKIFVDKCMIDNGFTCIYRKPFTAYKFTVLCQNNFYEVWMK